MTRPLFASSMRTCALLTAAFAMLVGGVVLIGGWAMDIATVRSLLPGSVTMKANTALALTSCGAALVLMLTTPSRMGYRLGQAFAAVAVLIGAFALAEFAFGWHLGIDEWLFADPQSAAMGMSPGRPAPNTALALLLLGLALLTLDQDSRSGGHPSEWLALTAGLIAFIGLLGYVYGAQSFYRITAHSSLAVHAAVTILVLALGILCARPHRGLMAVVTSDSAGGYMARRLLPTAMVVPPVMGGMRLLGQRAGFYDFEFGLALFVMFTVIVFVTLVWSNAASLRRIDVQRWRAQLDLQQANEALEARVRERTVALQTEVVERKKAEDQFRGLLESAPDGVVISDAQGCIILVNAQVETLFGYERAELIGQSVDILVPERFHAAHVHHRAGYLGEPRTRVMGEGFELFGRRKDGTEFPVDIGLSPIMAEQGMLIFSDIRDVSWRRQTEQALRTSETRFRAVAETANDAVIIANSHGNLVFFNEAAERIFGYGAREVIDQSLTLLMPQRFQDAHRNGIVRFLATGETRVIGQTVELVGRRKDGAEFPLDLSLASWQAGEEVSFIGIARDVTQRKDAERQIHDLNDDLTRRAVELEASNRELEAFSYAVSHDLRTPLRAIDGFSSMLLAGNGTLPEDVGRDYLGRVRRAAQHMGTLIDDLLKLSRITRTELVRTTVDLSKLVAEVAEDLQAQDPERSLRFEIAPKLTTQADPRLLRIALVNMLENACKFTAGRAQARIEFGTKTSDSEQVYFVRDNGAGFDMAYVDKLFGAFQRLHDANEFPGTGIGLATVQRIVHKHGGRLWAEGAIDQGATFYFTLG